MDSSQGSYNGEADVVEEEEVVSPADLKSVNLLVTFLEYIREGSLLCSGPIRKIFRTTIYYLFHPHGIVSFPL